VDRNQGRSLIDASENALTLRILTGEAVEMAALQCVLEAAPSYFRVTTGAPPRGALAQSTFTALPPDKTYDDKFVWGLYAGRAMIGCADVIRGYPTRHKAVIGLLLLAEPWQRRGLGRALAALVEQAITAWREVRVMRLGVAPSNIGALDFWKKLGYVATGDRATDGVDFVRDVIVLEKPVAGRLAI
jgi:ribosomal protein S18 acetylase RimI-like enzyme